MLITDSRIDAGKAFDWGKTSEFYAKYRDIYPDEFYKRVADMGLCVEGQDKSDRRCLLFTYQRPFADAQDHTIDRF